MISGRCSWDNIVFEGRIHPDYALSIIKSHYRSLFRCCCLGKVVRDTEIEREKKEYGNSGRSIIEPLVEKQFQMQIKHLARC